MANLPEHVVRPQSQKVTLEIVMPTAYRFRRGDNLVLLSQDDLYVAPGCVGVPRPSTCSRAATLSCQRNTFTFTQEKQRRITVHNSKSAVVVLHKGDVLFILDLFRAKDSTVLCANTELYLAAGSELPLADLDEPLDRTQFAALNPAVLKREAHTSRIVLPCEWLPVTVVNRGVPCHACISSREVYPFLHTHCAKYALKNTTPDPLIVLQGNPVTIVHKIYDQLFYKEDGEIQSAGVGTQLYVYAKSDFVVPGRGFAMVSTTFKCKVEPSYYLKILPMGLTKSRVVPLLYRAGALNIMLNNRTDDNETVDARLPIARAVVVRPHSWTKYEVTCATAFTIASLTTKLVKTSLPVPEPGVYYDIYVKPEYHISVTLGAKNARSKEVHAQISNHSAGVIGIKEDQVFAEAYLVMKNPLSLCK